PPRKRDEPSCEYHGGLVRSRESQVMARKHVAPEPIIATLHEAEVLIDQGKILAQASTHIGVTVQTYDRWRKEHGGLKADPAKRLEAMRPYQLSLAEWDAAGVSQLRMGFSRFTEMPAARPVRGYGFRTYRPGDEGAWIDTLSTGDFGVWDRARLDRMLAGERAPLPLEGVVFGRRGELVGFSGVPADRSTAPPV